MPLTPELWSVDNFTTDGENRTNLIQLESGFIVRGYSTSTPFSGGGANDGFDIVADLYAPDGAFAGSIGRLNLSQGANDESFFDLVALSDGGFLVSYVSDDDIYIDRFTANGTPVSISTNAIGINTVGAQYSAMAASGNSSVLITYTEEGTGGGTDNLVGRIYNPITDSLGSVIDLISLTGGDYARDVATLANGNYVIIGRNTFGDDSVIMRIIASNGNNVLSETHLGSTNSDGEGAVNPHVAALDGGRFVVTWSDAAGAGGRFQMFDSSGTAISGVATFAVGRGEISSISAMNDGGFIITIGHEMQRYNVNGVPVGNWVDVSGSVDVTTSLVMDDGRILTQSGFDSTSLTEFWDTRDAANTDGPANVGTIGNDAFVQSSGADAYGWLGNDIITESTGLGDIYGGDGDDTFYVYSTSQGELVNGGIGTDTLRVINTTVGVTINLDTESMGSDTIISIENVVGGLGNDTITGDDDDNVINGGAGNDTIFGTSGLNTLNGGTGNDNITGGDQADMIDGGSEDDIIAGGAGDDTIIGGTGNDHLQGSSGLDVLFGGTGDDILYGVSDPTFGAGNNANIYDGDMYGGDGSDTFAVGSISASATGFWTINLDHVTQDFASVGGNPTGTIYRLFSIENVIGGLQADNIYGNSEDNILYGHAGNDNIEGGLGNDTLEGGAGSDDLDGGVGDDTFIIDGDRGGLSVGDQINGNTGSDTLIVRNMEGWTAADVINLQMGSISLAGVGTISIGNLENYDGSAHMFADETVHATSGNNTIIMGWGNSTVFDYGGNDTLDGGAGVDTLSYDGAAAGVVVDLGNSNAQDTMGAGLDTITNFENITGSDHDDVLIGNSLNNYIRGGDGNDIILLGNGTTSFPPSGSDQISAGNGDDIVGFSYNGLGQANTGSGHVISGGNGTDTFSFDAFGSDYTVDLAGEFFERSSDSFYISDLESFENVIAGNGNDTILGSSADNELRGSGGQDMITGADGADLIYGNLGHDDLFGDSGNDTIFGGGGADDIRGGTGADQLDGGNGTDELFGNGGNDTLQGRRGSDELDGGNGDDTLNGGGAADILNGGNGDDVLEGGNGFDTLNGGEDNDTLNGRRGEDVLNGDNGDDILNGGGADDILDGGDGEDNLNGGDGSDVLLGASGSDYLDGGRGNDTLTGGTGSDTFRFRNLDIGDNTVTDLSGADAIELTGFGYDTGAGAQPFLTDTGNDVIFSDQGVTITFENTSIANVTAAIDAGASGNGPQGAGTSAFDFTSIEGESVAPLMLDAVAAEEAGANDAFDSTQPIYDFLGNGDYVDFLDGFDSFA